MSRTTCCLSTSFNCLLKTITPSQVIPACGQPARYRPARRASKSYSLRYNTHVGCRVHHLQFRPPRRPTGQLMMPRTSLPHGPVREAKLAAKRQAESSVLARVSKPTCLRRSLPSSNGPGAAMPNSTAFMTPTRLLPLSPHCRKRLRPTSNRLGAVIPQLQLWPTESCPRQPNMGTLLFRPTHQPFSGQLLRQPKPNAV